MGELDNNGMFKDRRFFKKMSSIKLALCLFEKEREEEVLSIKKESVYYIVETESTIFKIDVENKKIY